MSFLPFMNCLVIDILPGPTSCTGARHCEEPAGQSGNLDPGRRDCVAALAMTPSESEELWIGHTSVLTQTDDSLIRLWSGLARPSTTRATYRASFRSGRRTRWP